MPPRIFRSHDSDLWQDLVALLKASELVAVPTETVYGLAANAFDAIAVDKIFAAKKRPYTDPLIVHVAEKYAQNPFQLEDHRIVDFRPFDDKSRSLVFELMKNFWPGPLSILLPTGSRIAKNVNGGGSFVALRCPNHPLFLKLLEVSGLPLAAPSANRFGSISPTSAEDVLKELGDAIPAILDGGACKVGVESTVVKILEQAQGLKILRAGGISRELLRKFAAIQEDILQPLEEKSHTSESPGQSVSHYAPRKDCWAVAFNPENSPQALDGVGKFRLGVISALDSEGSAFFQRLCALRGYLVERMSVLSSDGDDHEAAHKLFRELRLSDENDAVDRILLLLPLKKGGLWDAIKDRMVRSASGRFIGGV